MKSDARFRRWANALVQLALIAAAIYLISQALADASGVRPVSYSEFIKGVREGKVESVQIGATELRASLRREQTEGAGQTQAQHRQTPPEIISTVRRMWTTRSCCRCSAKRESR